MPSPSTLAVRTDYELADIREDQLFEWLPYVMRARDSGTIKALMVGLTSQHNWVIQKLRELGRLRDPFKAGVFVPTDPVAWEEYQNLLRIRTRTEAEEEYLQDHLIPRLVADIEKGNFERQALNELAASVGERVPSPMQIITMRRFIASAIARHGLKGSHSSLTAMSRVLSFVDFKAVELWSRFSPRDPAFPASEVNDPDFSDSPVQYPYWPLQGRYDGVLTSSIERYAPGSVTVTTDEFFQIPVASPDYTPFEVGDGPDYEVSFVCHPDAANSLAFHRTNGRNPFGTWTERVNNTLLPGVYTLGGGSNGERAWASFPAFNDPDVHYRFEAIAPGSHANGISVIVAPGSVPGTQSVTMLGTLSELKFKSSHFDLHLAFDMQRFHQLYHPIPVTVSDEETVDDTGLSRDVPDFPVAGSADGTRIIATDEQFQLDWIRHTQETSHQRQAVDSLIPLTRTPRKVISGLSHLDQVRYAPVLRISEVNLIDEALVLWRIVVLSTGDIRWDRVTPYAEGLELEPEQFISNGGDMYRVKQAFVAPSTPPSASIWFARPYQDWANALPAHWDTDTDYSTGSLAYHQGYVYEALVTSPAGPPTDLWTLVGTSDPHNVVQQDFSDGEFYSWGITPEGVFTAIPSTASPLDAPRDTLVVPDGEHRGVVFLQSGFLSASFVSPEQTLESLHTDGTPDESIIGEQLQLVVENPVPELIPYLPEEAYSSDVTGTEFSFQVSPEDELRVVPTHHDASQSHIAMPLHVLDALGVEWQAREEDWGVRGNGTFYGRELRLRTAGIQPALIEPVPTGYLDLQYPVIFRSYLSNTYRTRIGRLPKMFHYTLDAVDRDTGATLVVDDLELTGMAGEDGDGEIEGTITITTAPADTIGGAGLFSKNQVPFPNVEWKLPYRRHQIASIPWGNTCRWEAVAGIGYVYPDATDGDAPPAVDPDGKVYPVGAYLIVDDGSPVRLKIVSSGLLPSGRPWIEVDQVPFSSPTTGKVYWRLLTAVVPNNDALASIRSFHPRSGNIEFQVFAVNEIGSGIFQLVDDFTSESQVRFELDIPIEDPTTEMTVWASSPDSSSLSYVELYFATELPPWNAVRGYFTIDGGDRDALELTILEAGQHWTDAEVSGSATPFTGDGVWRGGLWPDGSSAYEPNRYFDEFIDAGIAGWSPGTGEYSDVIVPGGTSNDTSNTGWSGNSGDYEVSLVALWDASSLIGDEGDPINLFPDESGNGNDLESSSPLLRLANRNGLNALEFVTDGDDTMLTPVPVDISSGSWGLGTGTEVCLFMVFKRGDEDPHELLSWNNGVSSFVVRYRDGDGNIVFECGEDGSYATAATLADEEDDWLILTALRKSTGEFDIRVNGILLEGGSYTSDLISGAPAVLSLCPSFRGFLGEVRIYRFEFSPETLMGIEDELAIKWGITGGKFQYVSDSTTDAGESAWAADGSNYEYDAGEILAGAWNVSQVLSEGEKRLALFASSTNALDGFRIMWREGSDPWSELTPSIAPFAKPFVVVDNIDDSEVLINRDTVPLVVDQLYPDGQTELTTAADLVPSDSGDIDAVVEFDEDTNVLAVINGDGSGETFLIAQAAAGTGTESEATVYHRGAHGTLTSDWVAGDKAWFMGAWNRSDHLVDTTALPVGEIDLMFIPLKAGEVLGESQNVIITITIDETSLTPFDISHAWLDGLVSNTWSIGFRPRFHFDSFDLEVDLESTLLTLPADYTWEVTPLDSMGDPLSAAVEIEDHTWEVDDGDSPLEGVISFEYDAPVGTAGLSLRQAFKGVQSRESYIIWGTD